MKTHLSVKRFLLKDLLLLVENKEEMSQAELCPFQENSYLFPELSIHSNYSESF